MNELRNLAILLFDDVEVLDFCGPFEVFSVASNQSNNPSFNVYTVAEKCRITARNGLSVNPDHTLTSCPRPDILLVPGGIGSRKQISNKLILDWIKQTAEEAELILSVCTGALMLGKVGFLDGLEVTTHHIACELLREIVPTATVHEDRRFVDNGRIITSAGIAAGIDMSLHVVERILGSNVAESTAQHMEYPWSSTIRELSMTDAELLAAFESCSLPMDQWTHRAHVRVAYLYASTRNFESAVNHIRERIKAFNTATNTPEAIDRGYHETITQAFMHLVYAAQARTGPHLSSDEFCETHPELMTKLVLDGHYSRDVLMSLQAKADFIEPDLAPLPVIQPPKSDALEVAPVSPTSDEAAGLIEEMTSELAGMYEHAEDGTGDFRPEEVLPNSVFLLGSVNGEPAACGAIRPLEAGVAEVKRMFVRANFRGQGFSRQILQALESAAVRLNYKAVRLETGDRQTSAISLYETSGYRRCAPFGKYVESTQSICFEKSLECHPFTIVPMTVDHVPNTIELWESAEGLILTHSDNPTDLARYFADNPGMSHVAVHQDQILGAVLCGHDGRRGYLHHLVVAAENRHQGIGRALVDACLSKLAEAGIRQCNLFIVDDNEEGRRFWASDGWSEWSNIRLMSKSS